MGTRKLKRALHTTSSALPLRFAPNPQDAGFIVNADNVASGSFKIRIKMLPTLTSASNYSTNDKLRVGYMIVNKSR